MISYNIYYSTNSNGPWTKANTSLVNDNNTGNNFNIIGLESGVIYYVIVVGGRLNDLGIWIPLSGQSIGPTQVGAVDITNPNIVAAKTFKSKGI